MALELTKVTLDVFTHEFNASSHWEIIEYPFTSKANIILLNVASIRQVVVPTSQFVMRSVQCLFVEACYTLIVFVPNRRVLTPSYFRIKNVKKRVSTNKRRYEKCNRQCIYVQLNISYLLQQYLCNFNSSKASFASYPLWMRLMYHSHLFPMTLPQVKQRTGIIIFFYFLLIFNYTLFLYLPPSKSKSN